MDRTLPSALRRGLSDTFPIRFPVVVDAVTDAGSRQFHRVPGKVRVTRGRSHLGMAE